MPRERELTALVSRFMFAQASASTAVSLGFFRRTVPAVVLAVLIAAALCGLAGMLRSGSHAGWLAAVTAESGYVAVGLFRFADARYLGGTLLAIVTLGALVHPAVTRAFAARHDWSQAADHPAIASPAMGESSS